MFKKGQGGRKPGAKNKGALDIRELIDSVVTSEDWAEIWKAVTIRARTGDDKCVKLLTEYRFGKPAQEITTPTDQPIQHNHTITPSDKLITMANKLADRN